MAIYVHFVMLCHKCLLLHVIFDLGLGFWSYRLEPTVVAQYVMEYAADWCWRFGDPMEHGKQVDTLNKSTYKTGI